MFIYDILEYIATFDYDGYKLLPYVRENNMLAPSSYTIEIRTEDGFSQLYILKREDMYRLETIRKYVDDIIADFCDKHKKTLSKTN